uniref:Uncharacterized protein n=1 Tax=Octopus bimaculoides TaxID=37653 RepID=A0A0L8IGS6_OCTBM
MALKVRLLFHSTCFFVLTYGILKNKWHNWYIITHNLNVLSLWNQWILWLFFLLSLVYDIILSLKSNHRIFREILTHYFNSIVFPMGIFVSVIFWSIFFMDTEFIIDLLRDVNNHIIHSLPLFMVLIEKFLVYHPYFQVLAHLIGIVMITTSYQTTVLFLRTNTGSWVYLFLDSFKFNSRLLFFLSMWPMMTVIYISGAKFNQYIWKNALSTLHRL